MDFYEFTIKFSSKVLSPLQVKLLKFALALRAMSPSVAMYNKVSAVKHYQKSMAKNKFSLSC